MPAATAHPTSDRVIFYYQTQYSNGQYVSLSPIWKHLDPITHRPDVTDVMVAAFHLGHNSNGTPYIHLNDNVPSDPMFDVMWPEVAKLQTYGITSRIMLGGAAQGSYQLLFSDFATFYPILRYTLKHYHLNGIDLDVEEQVSLSDIEMLIAQLRSDFGKDFVITLAPVVTDFTEGSGLSGFSYPALYHSAYGADVAWYNVQFYSGFGSMSSPNDYETIIKDGFAPSKIVAGTLVNPNDGYGFVPISQVMQTVHALAKQYPTFGGIDGWEYFDALPDGPANPDDWAAIMAKAMR
ncbi:MAG: chitinase [Candidatus Eremiobacteraeota bacterium]|nr:chitinase [Candidatus Eremiobacteraeota bacterium]